MVDSKYSQKYSPKKSQKISKIEWWHAWDKSIVDSKYSKNIPKNILQKIPKIELVTRVGQVNGWF